MKFSVLVPVYNTEKYLEQCLQSILVQTYQDFEIILVDDGSTDNSAEICDRYQNEYLTKVKVIHQHNQGLLAARRVGIKAAMGDYCVFVDSDDYVEPNLLEALKYYIDKNKVDVLLYSFRYLINDKPSDVYRQVADNGKIWSGNDKTELYEKLISSNDITAIWTKAVKTDILKTDPTDYTIYYGKNMAEDLLQSLYIITAAHSVGYIYESLYLYRINENSVSRSFNPATISTKNTIHVYEKFREYLPVWGLDDSEHHTKLNARWFNDVMYIFSKYYEGARNKKERYSVLGADWNSMIPADAQVNRSEYEHPIYQCLYNYLNQKKFRKIRLYFMKKKLVALKKRIKSKVRNGK